MAESPMPPTTLQPTPTVAPTLETAAPLEPRPIRVGAFLTEIAVALAVHGMATPDVEDAVYMAARRLGVDATVNVTPTSVLITVEDEDFPTTNMRAIPSAETDLAVLADLDEILLDVLAGKCNAREGLARIRAVRARPPLYGELTRAFATALLAATGGAFFGGGWTEVAAAGALGLFVHVLCEAASRRARVARLTVFLAGLGAALGAIAIDALAGPVSVPVVVLAGIVALLPGLSFTVAVSEVASRHLVSGSARLVGAIVTLLTLSFGVALGLRLGQHALGDWTRAATPVGDIGAAIALLAAASSMVVAFSARLRHAPVVIGAGLTGFLTANAAVTYLGPELGAFAGAIAVGVVANIYARLANRPAALALLPGVLLLVPGSLGFRSVTAFMQTNAIEGVQGAFTMAIVATGLVVGLLTANVITPSRVMTTE